MNRILFKSSAKYRVWGSIHLLFFLLVLGTIILQTLAIHPLSFREESFSVERALLDLQILTGGPRIPGTSFHHQVGEYIKEELQMMGLQVEVQKTTVLEAPGDEVPFYGGEVKNIIAYIPGTDPQGTMILGAPYDSIPGHLGSSDSAMAVAALLETTRILVERIPLKNDMILLFTDVHRFHSLGIRGFLEQHPRARDAQLFYFFEGIGPGSSSFKLETTPSHYSLIQDLSRAAPRALSYSIYHQLDTLSGQDSNLYNLLMERYRSLPFVLFSQREEDGQLSLTPQVIKETLKEYGESILGIVEHYRDGDLMRTPSEEAIYFNIFEIFPIYYPESSALPLFYVILALFLLLLYIGWKKGRLSMKRFIPITFFLLLMILTGVALITLIQYISSYGSLSHPIPYSLFFLLAFSLAFYSLLLLLLREEKVSFSSSLFLGLLLLGGLALLYPGLTFLLTIPLLSGLISLSIIMLLPEDGIFFFLRNLLLLIFSLPPLLLLIPVLFQTYSTMPIIGILLAMILCLLLTPQLYSILSYFVLTIPSLFFTLALLSLVLLLRGSPLPQQSVLLYSLDSQRERAVWATCSEDLDPYTSLFFEGDSVYRELPEVFPFSNQKFLQTRAPSTPLLPPEVELLLDNRMERGIRSIDILISSPRRAPILSLYLMHGTTVLSSKVNGHRLTEYSPPEDYWGFTFYGLPEDGIEVSFQFLADEPIHLRVIDESYYLPRIHGYERDFEGVIRPTHRPCRDSTFVSRSFLF